MSYNLCGCQPCVVISSSGSSITVIIYYSHLNFVSIVCLVARDRKMLRCVQRDILFCLIDGGDGRENRNVGKRAVRKEVV